MTSIPCGHEMNGYCIKISSSCTGRSSCDEYARYLRIHFPSLERLKTTSDLENIGSTSLEDLRRLRR